LGLAGRYDGIDLPGRSCKILTLDGLPLGTYLIDRFWERSLKIQDVRNRTTATRIVQAIGRIFRSNTDHGVVIICGVELKRWLLNPNHRRFMPKLLQQQVQLGIELFNQIESQKISNEELMSKVLNGEKDWDVFYSTNIDSFDVGEISEDNKFYSNIAAREREAYTYLWDGNTKRAIEAFSQLRTEVWDKDPRLGAWYAHLEGLSRDLVGNMFAAEAYLKAGNERSELGRPDIENGMIKVEDDLEISEQARIIASMLENNKGAFVLKLQRLKGDLAYGPDTNRVEEALRTLGELLGFKASRPDNELNTGPDVLWLCESDYGLGIEAKTGKSKTSQYTKGDDIGKVHDHIQWEKDNYKNREFTNIIVGYYLKVSSSANPPSGLRVVLLEQFLDVAKRLQEAIEFADSDMGRDYHISIEKGLRLYGLAGSECFNSLQYELAVDLKSDESLVESFD